MSSIPPSRYSTFHKELNSKVMYYLEEYTPNLQECRELLLKVIEQAKRDVVNYYDSQITKYKTIYEEAREFLFNDDYEIDWGGQTRTMEELNQILGLDLDWGRRKLIKEIKKIVEKRIEKDGEEKRN